MHGKTGDTKEEREKALAVVLMKQEAVKVKWPTVAIPVNMKHNRRKLVS